MRRRTFVQWILIFLFAIGLAVPRSPQYGLSTDATLHSINLFKDQLPGDKLPCERNIGFVDTLWVAMASWNDDEGLRRAIASVQTQKKAFSHVRLVIFEDRSRKMLSLNEKESYPGVVFLGSEQPKGAAYGKWTIFKWIRGHARPTDYVLVLDGDDVLADNRVFSDVRNVVYKHKPWFAYGKHNGKFSNQCGLLSPRRKRTKMPRPRGRSSGHLRSRTHRRAHAD